MKKTKVWLLLAMIAATFCVACTSVDEPAVKQSDLVVTVQTPTKPLSRTAVSLPAGYTMQCVMQLLDDNGNTVGNQKTVALDATTGKGSFTITGAERKTAVKALFWAHYINSAGVSVYNTSDLKNVGYNKTVMALSETPATDAFCGKLEVLNADAAVTLSRPFANVLFRPTTSGKIREAKQLTVSYTAPSGYSVLNSTASGTTALTFNNNNFDPTQATWFSTFIFAPVDKKNLESEITLNLGAGYNEVTIKGNTIPLSANFQITATGTIGDDVLGDITVSVEINPDFSVNNQGGSGNSDDPGNSDNPGTETAKFEVGAYVNASGQAVASASDAVAVVFRTSAFDNDDANKYASQFSGKTIKGYAVALKSTSETRQVLNVEAFETGKKETGYANGSQGTAEFLNVFSGNDFASTYNNFVAVNGLTGSNVSGWYIPTSEQLFTWLHMLLQSSDGAATGSSAFQAIFPAASLFEEGKTTTTYATCDFNSDGNPKVVRITSDGTATVAVNQLTVSQTANLRAMCRPMFTIFE